MSGPRQTSQLGSAAHLLLLGGCLLLLFSLCTPNYAGSRHSYPKQIISNLRNLEGAMQMWAQENGRTGAVEVTMEDVAPYLLRLRPVVEEGYVLKTLADAPEAVLTRGLGQWPKGTVIRLGTNGQAEIIPPGHGTAK